MAWAGSDGAKVLEGESLEVMQLLNSEWVLSQSGSVENRLARVLDKERQHEKGRHAFALAAAAGGGDVAASRDKWLQLANGSDAADKEIAQAGSELLQLRTIKMPAIAGGMDSAQFALIFDGSNKPDRVE